MIAKTNPLSFTPNNINQGGNRPWFVYAFLIFCTFLAIIYNGYGFGEGDQIFYLPYIYHWNNPNLFPNDYFLTNSYARESITWTFIAFLSKLIDIRILFAVLYFILRYLSLLLSYKIAYMFYKKVNAAWLVVFLEILVYPVIGSGYSTFDDNFCTRIVGTVLGLSSFYYFLKAKPYLSAIMIFAGGLFHIISIIPFFTGLLSVTIMKKQWKNSLIYLFMFLSSGFIIYLFASYYGFHHKMFVFYSGLWYKVFKSSCPNLLPHIWSLSTWSQIILIIATFYCMYLWKQFRNITTEMDRIALIITSSILMLFIISLIGSFFHFALLIQLCLMRGYLLFFFILTICIIDLASNLLESNKWNLILCGILILSCWITGNAIFQFLGVINSVFTIEFNNAANNKLKKLKLSIYFSLILFSAILFYILFMKAGILLLNISLVIVVFSGFIILSFGFYRKIKTPNNIILIYLLCLPPLLLPSLFLIPDWSRNKGFLGERTLYPPYELMEKEVREVIPLDATIIIPPNWIKFRTNTLRSSFVTFMDNVPSEFNPEYTLEWIRRIQEINSIFSNNDSECTEEKITILSNKYDNLNLDYIITSKQLNFPLISSVGNLYLYKINKYWYKKISDYHSGNVAK